MKKQLLTILCLLLSLQPFVAKAKGFTPFIDFLYWHVSEEATSIWSNVASSSDNKKGKLSADNINFGWNQGIRGGFLYEADRFLDTKLYWTYFPSEKELNHTIALRLVVPEFFSGIASQDLFFGANVKWRIAMNTLDLDVSHKFSIGESLFLRPFIGVKGANINQTINANWNAVIYTSSEEVKNDFWGIGPNFGIAGQWNFYKNLSLVGNFSTALMWGNWNVSDNFQRPQSIDGLISAQSINTSMKKSELGTWMLDFFLGLDWHIPVLSETHIKLGYEVQQWSNQLRLLTFQQLPTHGDLTIQGGICGIYINL